MQDINCVCWGQTQWCRCYEQWLNSTTDVVSVVHAGARAGACKEPFIAPYKDTSALCSYQHWNLICKFIYILVQLKEQLSHKEQSHSSELEGMKQEVTQLTRELHQRDIMLASSSGSTLNLEQQLRLEIEKAERKAVEHRVNCYLTFCTKTMILNIKTLAFFCLIPWLFQPFW